MARPKKQVVDYFPHATHHGETLFIIENKYGNDGYSFWFKLLELLGLKDGHYIDSKNSTTWEYLLAKTRVTDDVAKNILHTLANLNAIDPDLWKEGIIWSQNFVDGISHVYLNRRSDIPKKPVSIGDKPVSIGDKPVSTGDNPVSTGDNPVSTGDNPHSIVEYSIVKKTIEKESICAREKSFPEKKEEPPKGPLENLKAFAEFKAAYPKPNGKFLEERETFRRFCLIPENGWPVVIQATKNYAESKRVKEGIGIKDPKNFLGEELPGRERPYWREWIEPEKKEEPLDPNACIKCNSTDWKTLTGGICDVCENEVEQKRIALCDGS